MKVIQKLAIPPWRVKAWRPSCQKEMSPGVRSAAATPQTKLSLVLGTVSTVRSRRGLPPKDYYNNASCYISLSSYSLAGNELHDFHTLFQMLITK